ncbi:hypothetical protein B0H11DRAFT_1906826 [Mycena galericulata]|nr:hypothetical protein B0H11DRAFT_1906826 [Mycena galericulata]
MNRLSASDLAVQHHSNRLSATNLANHHHLNCDLYLHNIYHRLDGKPSGVQDPSELAKANFVRGLDWEQSCLLPFLDRENLLLTIPPSPVDGTVLSANLEADERDHFFVAGLAFWPPTELKQRFLDAGTVPVNFGLAKPDLLEITRTPQGITWKIVDAKASKAVKFVSKQASAQTPHHVQIYFYSLCLSYLLPHPFFRPAGSAAIWLPPADGFDGDTIPSLDDLKSINISLLAPSLDEFLFRRLPRIPLPTARQRRLALESTLSTLLGISRGVSPPDSAVTDIEDLHLLLSNVSKLRMLGTSFPSTLKKAKRILAVQPTSHVSPVLEAARTKTTQIIQRRNFTCPRREDIAVIISLIVDPSLSKRGIAAFCISVFSSIPSFQPDPAHGPGALFIPMLSAILQDILSLNAVFYVFSAGEQVALQAYLIDNALTSTPGSTEELRLCIGALAQGASLLQTTFQPLLLSGALLDFMAKGQRSKLELQTCLERMDLPTSGTADELRRRIQDEIRRLQAEGGRVAVDDDRRTELGQLPRVVVLKSEIESLLALPIPGSWDLAESAFTLLPPSSPDRKCPADEEIFDTYKNGESLEGLKDKLEQRNASIYAVLQNMRTRISASGARLLFEVLAKLTELWKARIEGCPDAPVLQYRETVQGAKGVEHIFYLVSGGLDMSGGDKDKAFYDYIMTEDDTRAGDIPVEALYDDLSVSGLMFPLNKYTRPKWNAQSPVVQQKLLVADLRDITLDGQRTRVTVQTWGGWDVRLVAGRHYRLSPRLVDFNITKVLSTLLELDMRSITTSPSLRADVPFLQLILNPRSFVERGKEFVKVENTIQSVFLSVLWGPPGTGKTYTIALALLRLLEVQHRLGDTKRKIIFITAMTHAAIEAVLSKLSHLRNCYSSIDSLPTTWLTNVKIEHVLKGNDHTSPSKSDPSLYNFSKRHSFEVDMCIIDEAGQLALSSAALVLRSLSLTGRIVIAGDSEQLAPILTAQYPQLKSRLLFGSILDCLMHLSKLPGPRRDDSQPPLSPTLSDYSGILNPDLGEFVSTIYSRAFKPQKVQARQLASELKSVEEDIGKDLGVEPQVLRNVQNFPARSVESLAFNTSDVLTPTPISLALVRLQTESSQPEGVGYEAHVRGEAALAAALIISIQRCSPGEDIFVATPHRIQRQAVKAAWDRHGRVILSGRWRRWGWKDRRTQKPSPLGTVTVDTVERLQGSEAAFVICLFSLPPSAASDLGFLLERRRLNVAISRAKTLCILVSSPTVLRPPVSVLANEENTKGYTFLRAFEDRSWSSTIALDVDNF